MEGLVMSFYPPMTVFDQPHKGEQTMNYQDYLNFYERNPTLIQQAYGVNGFNSMRINIIVAISSGGVIGYENSIPWNIKEDKEFFKDITHNSYLIMGSKTYLSLTEPLKDRKIIVLSKKLQEYSNEKTNPVDKTLSSIESALYYCDSDKQTRVFICGGTEVYRAALPYAHNMFITNIFKTYKGDTYFPKIPIDKWKLVSVLG